MTPREPDHFEAKALAITVEWAADRSRTLVSLITAALRREREDALNEAAQIADEYDNEEGHPSPQARALIRIVAERIRALAHPAAAPAADQPSEPVAPAPDLRGALTEAKDALEQIWAAIGDRLCGDGPLSKGYAQAVASKADAAARRINAALADGGEGK